MHYNIFSYFSKVMREYIQFGGVLPNIIRWKSTSTSCIRRNTLVDIFSGVPKTRIDIYTILVGREDNTDQNLRCGFRGSSR